MKKYILGFILALNGFFIQASHLIGGEMYYKYLALNDYEITVVYYRDCLPPSLGGGNPQSIANDEPLNLSVFDDNQNLVFKEALNNYSIDLINYLPNNNCEITSVPFCISKITFKKIISLLPGSNYTVVNERCCWGNSIANIINSAETGQGLRMVINTFFKKSSAIFKPTPEFFLCAGESKYLDFSATDIYGDSLSYSFCPVLNGGSTTNPKPELLNFTNPISTQYLPPATATQPYPNGIFSLNSQTGKLLINPINQGVFLIGVCVDVWYNGVKINSTQRNICLYISNCNYETKAIISCDSITQQLTNGKYCNSNCSNSTKEISFQNKSVGAVKYHWDFGISSSLDDTSNLAEPSFIFPANGDYMVTLTAIDNDCNDITQTLVHIGDEVIFSPSFNVTGKLCIGNEINFINTSSTSSPLSLWKILPDNIYSPASQLIQKFTFAGDKKIVFYQSNLEGCYSSSEKDITITTLDVKTIEDQIIAQGERINITTTGAQNYVWSKIIPSNSVAELTNYNIANPELYTNSFGKSSFQVIGNNSDGCIGIDILNVTVVKKSQHFAPTAFTPNGDNNNDVFSIYLIGYELDYLKIYNRRGQCVFTTNTISDSWNGKLNGTDLAVDVYFWQAKVLDVTTQEYKILKGDVTLLR